MVIPRSIALFIVAGMAVACSGDPYDVDTSSVDYEEEFRRLDRAVFDLPENPGADDLTALEDEYGDFLNIYFEDIMRVGPPDNPMTADLFSRFVKDPNWRELQETIESRHPDLEEEAARITEAFKRYAVHFDADTLPKLVAYNSGFNVGVYPTPQWLGVGLEWYSGNDHPIIDRLPPDLFPQYKRDKMRIDYLVPNAVKGWLMVQYANQLEGKDLLGHMVFHGKMAFVTSALLPDVPLTDILNYTQEQIQWCEKNEFDVWKHFVENDLIFTNDAGQINRMTGEGPFTHGMPPESPGGIGVWVGYRMVESYMKRNADTDLKTLIDMNDDRAFLNTYKPGR